MLLNVQQVSQGVGGRKILHLMAAKVIFDFIHELLEIFCLVIVVAEHASSGQWSVGVFDRDDGR